MVYDVLKEYYGCPICYEVGNVEEGQRELHCYKHLCKSCKTVVRCALGGGPRWSSGL